MSLREVCFCSHEKDTHPMVTLDDGQRVRGACSAAHCTCSEYRDDQQPDVSPDTQRIIRLATDTTTGGAF